MTSLVVEPIISAISLGSGNSDIQGYFRWNPIPADPDIIVQSLELHTQHLAISGIAVANDAPPLYTMAVGFCANFRWFILVLQPHLRFGFHHQLSVRSLVVQPHINHQLA